MLSVRNTSNATGRFGSARPLVRTYPMKSLSPTIPPKDSVERFDPNNTEYRFDKIYSPNGKLTVGQWVCTFLIRQVYQRATRSNFTKPIHWVSDNCPYKNSPRLSCSEFTLVAIHKMGVARGIAAGMKQMWLREPLQVIRAAFKYYSGEQTEPWRNFVKQECHYPVIKLRHPANA